MDVAGYPILGWLLLFAFCLFCGAGIFHLFYGAVTLFEGEREVYGPMGLGA